MNVYDVCVVGGGRSGTAAAIGAARLGARTVVCEATDLLGGMESAGMVSFFCVAHHDGHRMIIGGLFAELRGRLLGRGAIYTAPGGNPKMLEPYDAEAVPATMVVDATGDAVVARGAGVRCRKGREGDGAVMPVNYCYRFGPVNLDQSARELPACVLRDSPTGERYLLLSGPHPRIDAAIAAERAAGRLSIPRDHISAAISVPGNPTSISVNYGRVDCDDPTDLKASPAPR